jgi:glycosyltransferase involved in cell wall biosynthesis
MEKRKLCIVMSSHWAANSGGAELQVRRLIEELTHSADLELSYLARNIVESSPEYRYSLVRIETPRWLRRFGYWPDSVRLYRMLQRERPDIVYQRVGSAYTGICALYCRRNNKRYLWHVSLDNDLAPDIGRFPVLCRPIERRIRDYGIRHADQIITQTRDQSRMLFARFGKTSVVVPNFHDIPESVIEKRSVFTIVWVANLKPAKRPEAFLEIVDAFPDDGVVQFLMIGRGGDREPYSSIIKKASQRRSFSYLGELPVSVVNDIIGSAHCLVNTSKIEGFPNTFIQSWFRRTIVASLEIDPDKVLSEHGNGILEHSPGKLAAAIHHIRSDIEKQNSITKRAYEYACIHHSTSNATRLANLILDN